MTSVRLLSILWKERELTMNTIGSKIRQLIKDNGYKTVKDFYLKLKEIYGKSCINRSTLTRLLKDQVEVRERTLNQIAIILNVKTSSLREGTNAEISADTSTTTSFRFNDKASLRILKKGLPFGVEQLSLKTEGRTADMQDDINAKESLKWIYILVGKINVVIKKDDGWDIIALHKSQSMDFDARKLHYIANASKSTSMCLITHYPAENSSFYITS